MLKKNSGKFHHCFLRKHIIATTELETTANGSEEIRRQCQTSDSDSDSKEMKDECKKVDSARKKHSCPECGAILKSKWCLKHHQQYVHSKKFSTKSNLNVNIKTHTGKGLLKWTHCPKEVKTGSNLKRHLITHTKESKFMCPTCKYPVQSKAALKNHTVAVHTDNTPCKCKDWPKSYVWKQNLKSHMRLHADRSGCWEKKFVLMNIPDPASLVKNLRIKYGNPSFEENEFRPIEIEDCSELLKHIKLKYTIRPHDCPTCGNVFATKGTLERHVKIHENKKEFKCDYCGKEFRQKSDLTRHIRTHTGERPYTCCECPNTFATTGTMNNHIKMCHLKERLWKCVVCNYSFNTNSGLLQHKRTKKCIQAHAKAQTPSKSKQN